MTATDQPTDSTHQPSTHVTTAAERVAAVVTGHQDRGTSGEWDDAAGKPRHCSCGWSQTYPGRTDHGHGLWLDHVVALLLDSARPDAPQPGSVAGSAAANVLTFARAFVPAVQEVINDDAGDDPDPEWVYDRLIESLAVIDSLVETCGGEYAGSEHATQVGVIVGRAARAALAARGDAAAPTVTAEQVERLARGFANDLTWSQRARPWGDDSWPHVRRPSIDRTVARLREAGIKVEGGERP